MITPTGVTASEYWDAIKAGNTTHVRITFLGQNIVLTDDDIDHSVGIRITDIFNSDVDLVFGKAVCKQLETSIINSDRLSGLVWTGEFSLEFGVEINGTTEWVTIGYFSGEKPSNVTTVPTIEFTAYDRMILFDQLADNYLKTISYPATLQTIYDGLCAFVGVENVSGDELPNIMNRSYTVAPADMEGYTCRNVLAWIAEACGCYATITETGKVRMCWFETTSHVVTGDEEFVVESSDMNQGMTWDEADTYTWDEIENLTWNDVCGYEEEYAIDRIVIKQLDNDLDIIYPTGLTDGNTYMIVSNPFLPIGSWSDVTDYVIPLYNRLDSFGGYFPVNLDCIGNWCIEAGDIITVDVNEYTINVPIFTKTMVWNGFTNDEYTTTGQKVRDVYTSDANKQKILNSKEIKLMVNGKYYDIQSGIVIDADGVKISGGKYIDILSGSSFKVESGGSVDVKSGGNLNVESGGNIDIKGSGTLALTGSSVSISSGSTFDVTATNFALSSANKEMICGSNKFDSSGFTYTSGNKKIFFGQADSIDSSWMGGVVSQLNNTASRGVTQVFASPYDNKSIAALTVECEKTNLNLYNSAIYVRKSGGNSGFTSLGSDLYPFTNIFGTFVFASDSLLNVNNTNYKGYMITLAFNRNVTGYGDQTPADYPNTEITLSCYKNRPGVIRINPYSKNNGSYVATSFESDTDVRLGYDGSSTRDLYCRYAYVNREYYVNAPTAQSSREVKHGIEDMPSVGDRLDQLNPVTFIYDFDETESRRPGLIYEDAIDVMPEICTGDEGNKGISYIDLIPMLLKEIQDLRVRVKTLEER